MNAVNISVKIRRRKVRLNQVNCLRISQGHDGKWRVRAPDNTVLHEEPNHKRAYLWAHNNREYSKKTPRWTEEELNYLAENYGLIRVEQICKHLRRSKNALKIAALRKRSHHGEHLNQRSNIYTARAAAKVMGLS